MQDMTFYHAPTLKRALMSSAYCRIVQGPVESGKSVWLLAALYKMACEIPRCVDGIRRSRFLITRQTEAELTRGIMKTFRDWFPEDVYGEIKGKMPATITMRFLDCEMEVEFFAFDGDSVKSLKRLRSTEYTAAGINEGQYESLKFFLAVRQRTGRYPPPSLCPDYDRKKRVVMDMNAPPEDLHWVALMRGDIPLPGDWTALQRRQYNVPDTWAFFVQPPVVRPIYNIAGEIESFEMNPDAENLVFQDPETVLESAMTGDIDDVKRDLMNLTVQMKSGKPRYPKFQRDKHVAKEELHPVPDVRPVIGYDPGINGGAVFMQNINGRWRATHEIYCRGNPDLNSAAKVGKRMLQILQDHFPWWKATGYSAWGDPFGTRAQTGPEDTYYKIIGEFGIHFQLPEIKDNPTIRWEIGKALVSQFPEGNPRIELCPIGCPMLVDAFDGGATMAVEKMTVGEGVKEVINKKNPLADIMEAWEYGVWGGGEGASIVEIPKPEKLPPVPQRGRMRLMDRRAARGRGRMNLTGRR